MAQTYNGLFADELLKVIATEREDGRGHLEDGGGIRDYAAYREQVGFLRALRWVEDRCPEIRSKIDKR